MAVYLVAAVTYEMLVGEAPHTTAPSWTTGPDFQLKARGGRLRRELGDFHQFRFLDVVNPLS